MTARHALGVSVAAEGRRLGAVAGQEGVFHPKRFSAQFRPGPACQGTRGISATSPTWMASATWHLTPPPAVLACFRCLDA